MNEKITSLVLILLVAGAIQAGSNAPLNPGFNNTKPGETEGQLKKFNSPEEIKLFLERNNERSRGYVFEESLDLAVPMTRGFAMAESLSSAKGAAASPAPEEGASGFSTTNIQVAGVDEADIVKNDGKYLYVISKNKVYIINAYPPGDAEILSMIEFKGNPQELYVSKNRIVVLGNDYGYVEHPVKKEAGSKMIAPDMMPPPGRVRSERTAVYIYDISDRRDPELIKKVSVDGNYFDSRLIGDYVYVIANQYTIYYGDTIAMPEVSSTSLGATTKTALDVYYFDVPDNSYSYTNIVSINTRDASREFEGKTYLMGSAQNLFVSQSNIYVTYQRVLPQPYLYESMLDRVLEPLVPSYVAAEIKGIRASNRTDSVKVEEIEKALLKYLGELSSPEKKRLEEAMQKKIESLEREIARESEKTVVHRIGIEDGNIEYGASGMVPGQVLNQFSMDEFDGYFRIATTTGHMGGAGAFTSANHIYIMDKDLEIVGWLEDLAPGERIYSARFMGKRAYLVTFQKIDPLFVIDLSSPEAPRVLGKLKIPGYSDYLHPYDENHVIGLGKDAVEADEGDFAWYQGVKLALFDVSDVEKPKEVSKIVIGDRGTDSYALQDHKAFLFSREKKLLVIPILLAEIDREKYQADLPRNAYGDYVWEGAYVFSIDAKSGIRLKGRVSHSEDTDDFVKSGGYYFGSEYSIKRSLYMDDALYTVSEGMIKMNDLTDLDEVNRIYLSG